MVDQALFKQRERQLLRNITEINRPDTQNNGLKLSVQQRRYLSLLLGAAWVVILASVICQLRPHEVAITGVIDDPYSAIGPRNRADLTGTATFGWETRDCSIAVHTNGQQFVIDSGGGNALRYRGTISGNGKVAMYAAPADSDYANEPITLAGPQPNTYIGETWIRRGWVALDKPSGVPAIPGDLRIGSEGDNDGVKWNADEQVSDLAAVAFVGYFIANLDLAGRYERLGKLQVWAEARIFLPQGSELFFADSSKEQWDQEKKVWICDWAGRQASKLVFGASSKALRAEQLAAFRFLNPQGRPLGIYKAEISDNGEILPSILPLVGENACSMEER